MHTNSREPSTTMFRIRRVHDVRLPADREAVAQAQEILRRQLPGLNPDDIDHLPDKLDGQSGPRFRGTMFVADNLNGRLRGFALMRHAADLRFCYLEYIAAAGSGTGGGIGGALYERVREEARDLGAVALLFECLPDDPSVVADPAILKQNAARLRFYEKYGARPIVGTAYETPVREGEASGPHLVLDDLGRNKPLALADARAIVKALLQRAYAHLCSPAYIERIVRSFRDDPVQLRPFRYVKPQPTRPVAPVRSAEKSIVLVVNDKHQIHHVRERGYVESPVRIKSILDELDKMGCFDRRPTEHFTDKHIRAVHDPGFVDYLAKICTTIGVSKSIYPYVFPVRNAARPPKEMAVTAGYYCIDTFTPLNGNAYVAAKRAVDCALTAARAVENGEPLAYALVRPPGHHAEHRSFGGFCYFNSNAVAAHYLSRHGRVAILDIDYHHGNGQQDIFYERPDVLTVSIHGHPRFAYPYFSGFEEERGAGAGEGFNRNYALPEKCDGAKYREWLARALRRVREHKPLFLVLALGLDPARNDPTGTWSLAPQDFEHNGRMIGELGIPTLVVQEGGYRTRTLGVNARHFFAGLLAGARLSPLNHAAPRPAPQRPKGKGNTT